ncbi:hypothetical protein [Spirosoma rhododendri]|uniref:hypothetical protein n=1 Tax=Spirosoma rhododendri TaxID=2728024 RepID=UPI0020C27039|nr:hypothetical protein [Spirosoma rhododendri]
MKTNSIRSRFTGCWFRVSCLLLLATSAFGQKLQLTEKGYFDTQGLNVLVFSSEYNGMFFDEKTAGIEMIHHGVRTSTGGAVRLQNTPNSGIWCRR